MTTVLRIQLRGKWKVSSSHLLACQLKRMQIFKVHVYFWPCIEKSLSSVSVELCCGACGHVYTVVQSSCAEKALLSNSVIII